MLKSISMAIELRNKAKDKYLAAYGEFEKQQNIYKRVLLNSEKTREGACTYIHTYVHTYIHTYIHMYIHTELLHRD